MNYITSCKILIRHIEDFYGRRDIMLESDYNQLKKLSSDEAGVVIRKQSDEIKEKDERLDS